MVVFENTFIKMDLEPSSDILSVVMPDVDSVMMPEIKRLLSIIVEQVKNYDVKKLLIDARKTQVEVSEETYIAMMSEFMNHLLSTRLQKLARIVSNSSVRENVVKKVYSQELPIQMQSFIDVSSATEWLKEKP